MNDQLRFSAAIHSYSCTCTVKDCGWFAGGMARNKAEADMKARAVLAAHLFDKHNIPSPRIK